MTRTDAQGREGSVKRGGGGRFPWLDRARSRLQAFEYKRHVGDVSASLTGAIAGVPDGMASSVIIGINPIHGLYASIFGPILGGLTARTSLLIITTTGASALAATEVISDLDGDQRLEALLLITLLAGLFQFGAGFFGLARLTNFVSHSVMTGFLTGVATLIILGQLGTVLGYEPEGANSIAKTADLLGNLAKIDSVSAVVGLATAIMLIAGQRTKLRSASALIALAIPSLVVSLASLTEVATVRDVGDIPSGIPVPSLPDFSLLSFPLLTGSVALAAIIFVQTAGVSQGLQGPGLADNPTGDLRASGVANMGVALLRGQPVGGSLSQSALNVQSGASSRLAAILSGIWILIIILLFSGLVEGVVMPSLAALLIVAAIGAIDLREAASIWQVGWGPRLTIVTTFLLTLLLPIQVAVGIGVALSALLYLSSASTDVHVRALVHLPSGELAERQPERYLDSDSVTVLQVYGSLFFAGARTLAKKLPEVGDSVHTVVVLRLRGKTRLGATAISVLSGYAQALQEHDGRLFLAGLSPELQEQLAHSGKIQTSGVRLYPALSIHGKSVLQSYGDARRWLVQSAGESTSRV